MGWLTAAPANGGAPICVAGLFYPGGYFAQIAWLGNFHASAFSHELAHAAESLQGISDPNHISFYFTPNGGLVQTANTTLQNDNL